MSDGGGGAQAAYSLAFRVMRMCIPAIFSLAKNFQIGDNDGKNVPEDYPRHSSNPRGILGETLDSCVHVYQSAEIQTEKQRIVLLLDTSKSPIESIVTLLVMQVCVVKENSFLEVCIENNTKSNLYMDPVEFEPAQNWTATVLKADGHLPEHNLLTREVFKEPILIRAGGGIYNYLYQLRLSSQDSARVKLEGSNVIGKLLITWRTNLGEPGRLQTQNILGKPITRKEIELQAVEVPSVIILEKPCVARLNLVNQTDRVLGPFEVWLSESNTLDEKTVMVTGLQAMTLGEVLAFSPSEFQLNLIAVKNGIQKISGITVLDTIEKKTYDSLLELEVSCFLGVPHYYVLSWPYMCDQFDPFWI